MQNDLDAAILNFARARRRRKQGTVTPEALRHDTVPRYATGDEHVSDSFGAPITQSDTVFLLIGMALDLDPHNGSANSHASRDSIGFSSH